MEIYKNSSFEIQALIRSYYRPIHPCATLIKTEFNNFIDYFDYYFINQFVDISTLINLEYFQGYKLIDWNEINY
jgi:hypothetical protein